MKEDYEPDNIVESKSIQFTDYIYILDQKDLKQKVEGILREINLDDKDLEEERMKKILEEVKDDIMNEVNALKRQSHQYTEDRKILVNIEANLKNLKIDEYLRKFKQDFEEVKQGQQKIVKSIEIGQEENRENFNQLSQKQDIHHDNNKREHKKTQEGVEEVVEVVKDNNKKINEIHEVVVTQKSKQTKETIWFDVKDPVELFTGREEELDNLHIVLGRSQGRNNPTVISQMTSISGLGGVGKSELARRYAQKYSSNYDGNVIWINAENRGTLESSFLNLAQDNRLGIPIEDISGKPKTIESIVKEIYEFFAKRRSLFIFNNAENDNNLKKFLQLCKLRPDASKPYILITSRNREWEKGIEVINLSELKLKDAIEFVKKGLNIGDESQGREIKALVEKLQCFPLAIQQAIAYIEDQRVTGEFSINNYLEKYEKKTKDLLNSDVFGGIDNDYAKTTFTTWQITIDRIKKNKKDGELASKILDVIAYLAPENINREMFLSLAEDDEERLKSAVRLLIKYSMVNGEQKQSVLSIHRLVQEVTRLELKEQNREKDILGKALELISAESTYHVASVWKYVSKYGRLIENFDQELDHTYGYSSATILHLLAENGDHEAIKNILKHALNIKNIINAEDKYKRTPLYIAAENSYVNVVELLASKGAKINTKSTIAYASLSTRMASGWTPLHVAAFNGHLKVVELLINKDKALLDIKDSLDRTPLVLAVNAGRLDIARFINPNDDVSLLHIAVQHNGLETVKGLVEKNASIINSKLGDWTPLHLAAFSGDLSIVKFLVKKIKEQNIEKKDGINHPSNDGFTPLHAASSNGHLEVVKLLISEGANFQAVNKEGWTLLHAAAQNGCLSVVEYLIDEKEFDVNICDGKNDTPLHTAAFHGKLNVVKFLLGEKIKKKADIDFVDTLGATPLLSATLNNNREIIKFLLEEGAKVIDVTDDKTLVGKLQLSVLHVAAMYDDNEMIKYLIDKKGIDKDIGKDISLTPLHVAAFFGSSKAIDCLIEKKSSVDVHVQVSKVKTVFDSVKEDIGLKIPSIGGIVNGLMGVVSYIGDNIQLTANLIYKIRGYPENKLLSEKQRGLLCCVTDLATVPAGKAILSIDYVSRQINNLETYVNRRKDQSSSLPMDAIFFTGEGIHQEEQTLTANECLPNRKKREAEGECLFTWEDVDEFNEEKDEVRDLNKIKIDSEKFINYIKNLPEEKRSQLIQLASEVKIGGNSQGLVSKLTNNQKVMSHLGRIGRISGMTMHGMMAKNILADFLNGNDQGVAINVGFIAGGQGFAKVAQAASLKGLELASDGKLFLGRSLRAASPFLARGTSAFVIYDLVNQVKEFKNGTEEALAGVIGDSIYLGVDAAEIGIEIAEAFEVLEGVSSVTGPIGAAIGAVVFVGTDIYMAVKRVDKIDQIIHLKGNEKFIEGLRAFIGMQPEQYIEELLEEKQLYNQLVKQGFEYLQQHEGIQRYVFPTGKSVVDSCRTVPYKTSVCDSGGWNGGCFKTRTVTRYAEECTTKFEVDQDNTVVLDEKRDDIKWRRAKPDNPNGGQLFCLPQGSDSLAPNYGSYLCKGAIGVADLSISKAGNHTLINLGEGDDYAQGFTDSPNIFLVTGGPKNLYGGHREDIFVLQGDVVKGFLSGAGGIDTLDLTGFAQNAKGVDVYLQTGDIMHEDYRDNVLRIYSMERVLGRKNKADRIFSACNTQFIDGQGGNESAEDYINIFNDNGCTYKTQVVVRPNTLVYNRASEGNFHYTVPYGLGSAKIDFMRSYQELNLNNTFTFEYEPIEIRSIDARNERVLNRTSHTIYFNFSPMSDKEFNLTISGASNPVYRLGSNTEVKVGDKGNLYMLQNTNQTVEEVIRSYLPVANRLKKMSFFIQSLPKNETVVIGGGNHEVIHNNPQHKSHLVGNGGENVYVITSNELSTEKFPISEVIIYDVDQDNSTDTMDLRNIIKQAKEECPSAHISSKINSKKGDLVIALYSNFYFSSSRCINLSSEFLIASIVLKNALANEWYKKLHVVLNNVPVKINLDNNEWSLKPLPIVFEKDKEFIVVTGQDIEENTELITPRKAGSYTFVRNKDDLIITNAFDAKEELCSITLSKFYKEPKMGTLSVKFADKEVVLKEHQEQISTAKSMDTVKKEHKEQVYNSVFNRTEPEVIMLSDQPVAHEHKHRHSSGHRHQVRHRRSNDIASSSAKPSSWINDLFGWVKSSISGLLDSKSSTTNKIPISQIDAKMDVNGTIMLLDLLIRKVTGQKYISTVDQSISPLEAQGYALNITGEFEKVVEQAAKDSKISMHRLNIDYMGMQKEIAGKVMSGKFNEISGVLKSYVEKACPGREAGCPGKLSPKKFDKFMVQFNSRLNVVLNQPIQQMLHNRDGRLEVDGTKKQQMSLEPQSYLSNASIQSHSKDKVSTCLSEIGVTKLGGNLNR